MRNFERIGAIFFVLVSVILWVITSVSGDINLSEANDQILVLKERLNARVSLDEYKTVVSSLDSCNERLHWCVVEAYENDYSIQMNQVIERFQPDTSTAEDMRLCNECAATCEEQLDWCYYYRDEACECLDAWEE